MRTTISGTLLLCLAALGSPSGASPRTHEFQLDNGLKLIVQEDHRAPVAVVQVWYRVGSSYEHDGITGVSHALEHMMFKRTKNLDTGEFSTIVSANGGRENAFTSSDYTAYFQQWSAENVALSFELEAERMQNLVIEDDEFAKEINVVLEERRLRTDDNPQALAQEVSRAVAFQTSPYRQPVIGWAADIKNMTAADLRGWYDDWYGPNNATVVVVGDVDPSNVLVLAKKHFGALKKRDIRIPKPRPEVEQHGLKRVSFVSAKAKVPFLAMGYKAPTLARTPGEAAVEQWEIYALDVLAAALSGDESARLRRNLQRGRELASEISAGYSSVTRLGDLFYFSAVPRPGTSLEALEEAIIGEIEQLRKETIAVDELDRIKTQVVADTVFERDSMFYQGMMIGTLESVGLDWRLKDTYVDSINAVTQAQVLEVAKKYLRSERLTVAYLMPEDTP